MDKTGMMEDWGKTEEELDEMINHFLEVLNSVEMLVTPTYVKSNTSLSHYQTKRLKRYLLNQNRIVEVPSSDKGALITTRKQLKTITDNILGEN